MKKLGFLIILFALTACEEPVPVEDVYQSEKDRAEVERQEQARVGADGLNAVGCLPDDTACIAAKAQEALNELDD